MTPAGAALAVTAFAVALRVSFVLWTGTTPGFVWIDPDDYLGQARLFGEGRIVDAFRYADFFKAPLYPVFLAACRYLPGPYPLNAAVAQAVLSGGMTYGVFALARRVSPPRLAVGAAAVFACFFPDVMSLMTFMQERVYLPALTLALVALVRLADDRSVGAAAVAGVCVGLAALGRSMPLYFAGPALGWLYVTSGSRRTGVLRVAACAGALAVVVVPYSIWLSGHAGRTVLVEDIAAYGMARLSPEGRVYFGDEMPTLVSTTGFLWHRFSAAPGQYMADLFAITRGMFQVPGGSWLEEHGHARTLRQALAMKTHAHVGGDLPFAIVALLAPVGLLLGRARRPLALIGLWVGVHLLFTALSGYGGQRFRQPIDVSLFVLASAVFAASWRSSGWRWPAVAAFVLPIALGLSDAWRPSLAARADYGVIAWRVDADRREADVRLPAGFTLAPAGPVVEIAVSAAGTVPVRIAINGYEVAAFEATPVPRPIVVPYRGHRVFVEATPARPGADTSLTIAMHGRR